MYISCTVNVQVYLHSSGGHLRVGDDVGDDCGWLARGSAGGGSSDRLRTGSDVGRFGWPWGGGSAG